jgi:hypothetical protein
LDIPVDALTSGIGDILSGQRSLGSLTEDKNLKKRNPHPLDGLYKEDVNYATEDGT